ncbi:MAG: alkaline phosphatase, partial [Chitinophagaceae bacterium]
MYKIYTVLFFLLGNNVFAQPATYTVANLHSHNDYEKQFPFWEAYNQGFGSIEADVFLRENKLLIAHDTIQLKMGRTFDSFYLQPLQQCIKKNNGFPYADHQRQLQLLVDLKTDAVATLNKIIEVLQQYPLITACPSVKIVITGNRPPASTFDSYPSFINFDGELYLDYSAAALT